MHTQLSGSTLML